jgi:hypothetical protein
MNLALTESERGALVTMLRTTISADKFPLSPRIRTLRSILEKFGTASTGGRTHPGTQATGRADRDAEEGKPAAPAP